MSKPTDRLGQPLSVGDWVVYDHSIDCPFDMDGDNGKSFRIIDFGHLSATEPVAYFEDGENGHLIYLTKINPKPETTTWDKCVFVPEGVTCQ